MSPAMHSRFSLTLIVNHACNLRCTYCYTGEKLRRPMSLQTGRAAINRAVNSLAQHGELELGFFGGEPLIEAELILELISYAQALTEARDLTVQLNLTTNGTIETPAAWQVMRLPELDLAVSHDGLSATHDRHRLSVEGRPTSAMVERTLKQLLVEGRNPRMVLVVRPDTVDDLTQGLQQLHEIGARRFDPSLDLWTKWTRADGARLLAAIRKVADFWVDHLPEISISWFDEKALRITGMKAQETARCGFGVTQLAVAPSGRIYPCERIVGSDDPLNQLRLPGNVFDEENFLSLSPFVQRSAAECANCDLQGTCSTTCRCSNFIRTGDISRPDGLLCLWDQACHNETERALSVFHVP